MNVLKNNPDIFTAKWKQLKSDLSIISLLISNLIVIILAMIQRWSVVTILWIYWSQSSVIGIFFVIKILLANMPRSSDAASRKRAFRILDEGIASALLFLSHYGIFHYCYALFLARMSKSIEPVPIILVGSIFFINQWFTFSRTAHRQDRLLKLNRVKLFLFPYARIIPMNAVVIIISILQDKGVDFDANQTLLVFLLLKTAADVTMHIYQLKGFTNWPSSEIDNAGPLTKMLTGKTRDRKFAEIISRQMKIAYAGKQDYRVVKANGVERPDSDPYCNVVKDLKSTGFIILGDVENNTLAKIHPRFRTLIKYMVNKDRSVIAAVYRIVDKQNSDAEQPEQVVALTTELSNGCFLVTTDTPKTLSTAPGIFIQYSALQLIAESIQNHTKRVEEYLSKHDNVKFVPINSIQDAIDSENRQNLIYASYSKTIPPLLWKINKMAEPRFRMSKMENVVYEMRKLKAPKQENT